jgi:hypothetical protein
MWNFDFLKNLKSPEYRLAWLIAIAADAIQIGAMPFFAEGGVSPADTVLDLAVGAILVRLLGWHWALLPTFAAEMLPGIDLFPTWTAAVFFMTRRQIATQNEDGGEVLPPGPAPEPRP